MTTYVSAAFSWDYTSSGATSVATYKLRLQNMSDGLLGAGLIQTADTGQLNISAIAALPALGANSGYKIFRFNDSRQGVDPLFLKVFFGVGTSSTNYTRLQVQTGTGTNGAGTLTGQLSTLISVGGTYFGTNTTPNVQVYACHTEGFFVLLVGLNNDALDTICNAFSLSRTRDAAGAFDSRGNILWTDDGTQEFGAICFTRTGAGAFTGVKSDHYCMVPGLTTPAVLLNGDNMLFPHFYVDPDVKQLWSQFTADRNAFSAAPSTFTASPMYGVSRTFLGSYNSARAEINSVTFRIAFLWE